MATMNKSLIIGVAAIVIVLVIASIFFLGGNTESNTQERNRETNTNTNEQAQGAEEEQETETAGQEVKAVVEINTDSLWKNAILKDVVTGKEFTIEDFKGKPILVESFAVWCPKCTQQQKETKQLHEMVGDDVVSIAIGTDPNEDEATIKEHVRKNGFTWLYAVSPPEVTQSLIDEFGLGIVSAPSVPVIYIDETFNARLLDRGVKSAEELRAITGV